MSRRKRAVKREYLPDPKYGDTVITRFLNQLMYNGKKSVAEGILYGALDIVAEKHTEDSPLEAFKKALEKVRPSLEVKSRRVGGATYQVPIDVRPARGVALSMRWLIKAARSRNEYYMKNKLANEILDALKGTGGAFKKKEDTHKMADANRAFAHFKW